MQRDNFRAVDFVVDTNIISRLVGGQIRAEDLPKAGTLFATHVQIDELSATPDSDLRSRLLLAFVTMEHQIIATESFVAGVSRAGYAKASSDNLYTQLKEALFSRDKRWKNNAHDAQIAEVAIKKGFTLLTADRQLAEVAEAHGGKVQLLAT